MFLTFVAQQSTSNCDQEHIIDNTLTLQTIQYFPIPNPTRPTMSAAEETKPIEAVAAEAPVTVEEPAQVEETAKAEEKAEEVKPAEAEAKEADIIKTTAQIDQKTHANNVKFDPSLLKETDDPVEIRKQVRCSNLRRPN